MEADRSKRAAELREGNNLFRRSLRPDMTHHLVFTDSVASDTRLGAILVAVQNSPAPDAGNDPYGEADFGAVSLGPTRFYWKIDYMDRDLRFGVNPYSQTPFVRVMTIMRDDEY